jgi:transglutaminase-like putative cysteine protease
MATGSRRIVVILMEIAMMATGWIAGRAAIPPQVVTLTEQGRFSEAQQLLKQRADDPALSKSERVELLNESERLNRIRYDFSIPPDEMLAALKNDIPDVTLEDLIRWGKEGSLEAMTIDGQLFYFRRAAANLFRLSPEAAKRKVEAPAEATPFSDRSIQIEDYMAQIVKERQNSDSRFVMPRRYRIKYRLTVHPDAVPAGETIRCWLLYPRERANQKDIRWIGSTPEKHLIAPNEALQRTVYLEQPAVAGQPARFEIQYEVTTWAQYEPIDPSKVQPYDTSSDLYREFTAERPPHLAFPSRMKALAREIVGDEKNPYLKAKRIFKWINDNIRYTTAVEYSTILDLTGYVESKRRGDCGVQGLLFTVLCRIEGIPAKWQSGWSLLPWQPGMHDWAEFYIEPYGWLPADPSRGLRPVEDEKVRWFNFGNMDPFRLIGNDDYGSELIPPKEYWRSEPVDFQRGEVEWRGGNLYFDQWDYEIEVEHLE